MLARKKSSRCINNKFTFNWQILALLSLMQKILQLQKNGKKYFDRAPPVLFSLLKAWQVKRKITLVAIFWEALRHICVTSGA
jgi:hypothetical protein